MIQGTKQIRKDFKPLSFITNMVVTSTASGPNQVFNSLITPNEYEPDRSVTPLVIKPEVFLNVSDGSVTNGICNASLSSIKWYIEGTLITSAWSSTEYAIDATATANKGTLTVKKNITPGQRLNLKFTAVYTDTRLGLNIPIEIEGVVLETTEKARDKFSIAFEGATSLIYIPFEDTLLYYDAAVAAGAIVASTTEKAKYVNNKCYERTLPFKVFRGTTQVSSADLVSGEYGTLSLVQKSITGTGSKIALKSDRTGITLDMRYIDVANYDLVLTHGSNELCREPFSVIRKTPDYTVDILSQESFEASAETVKAKAIVTYGGAVVDYPLSIISLNWFTESYKSATETNKVSHGSGVEATINIANALIGNTPTGSAAKLYVETDYLPIKS